MNIKYGVSGVPKATLRNTQACRVNLLLHVKVSGPCPIL